MQINSLSRPGCLAAPFLSHHKAEMGGRKEGNRRKGKDGEVGRRHEIRFVLTTKAIRRAEREESRHPREVEECSTTTCPAKGWPGRSARRRRHPWPRSPRKCPRGLTGLSHVPGPACAQPGAPAAGEEEEEEAEEDTKPASLTQKMTLKPKMKYLMQQLTSGPL